MRETLDNLCQHRKISREEAKNLLIGIAQGEYDPVLVSSFLTVFRMRNVTVEELLGFRDAMLELAHRVSFGDIRTVDLCGTGGDGKDTFNISTLASFVAAGAGAKVTKHGNVGVSSSCGSSDVLLELGAKFSSDENLLREQLKEANFCYLHAPLFHPAMKNVAPIRKALGVRTFFNLLGPLVNPSSPSAQLIGVFSLEIGRLFHYLLSQLNREYFVVHTISGYDEVSLTDKWRLFGRLGAERYTDRLLEPSDIGLKKLQPEQLSAGTKGQAVLVFENVLQGKGTNPQNDVVVANAAYAIQLWKQDIDIHEALEMAKESLLGGSAYRSFQTFKEISNKEKDPK